MSQRKGKKIAVCVGISFFILFFCLVAFENFYIQYKLRVPTVFNILALMFVAYQVGSAIDQREENRKAEILIGKIDSKKQYVHSLYTAYRESIRNLRHEVKIPGSVVVLESIDVIRFLNNLFANHKTISSLASKNQLDQEDIEEALNKTREHSPGYYGAKRPEAGQSWAGKRVKVQLTAEAFEYIYSANQNLDYYELSSLYREINKSLTDINKSIDEYNEIRGNTVASEVYQVYFSWHEVSMFEYEEQTRRSSDDLPSEAEISQAVARN